MITTKVLVRLLLALQVIEMGDNLIQRLVYKEMRKKDVDMEIDELRKKIRDMEEKDTIYKGMKEYKLDTSSVRSME